MKVAAQHLRAEGMQRGNVRLHHIPRRIMQPGAHSLILRLAGRRRKAVFHALLHLRCGGVGKRDTEKLTRGCALRHKADEAFRENRRFA